MIYPLCVSVRERGEERTLLLSECLVDGDSCPNCARLRTPVQGLSFPLPYSSEGTSVNSNASANASSYLDPNSSRYVQLAEVYVTYRNRIEAGVPESLWDPSNAIYFACTILTTIGYGNFAPKTNASKTALIVLSIPGIALFGLCLSSLSSFLLGAVTWLKDKIPVETTDREHVAELDRLGEDMKAWSKLIKSFDGNGTGLIELPEFLLLGKKLDEMMGQGGHSSQVTEKMKRRRRLFLKKKFEKLDVDNNGALDTLEVMGLVLEVVKIQKQQARTRELFENLTLNLLLTFVTYFVGSLVFYALSDGWSFTDAFYFTAISLTTIGLGDFTPDANQLVFWYFYVALNLGLVASVIQGLSELATLMAANARWLAEVIEQSIDDVLTIDDEEFSGEHSPTI